MPDRDDILSTSNVIKGTLVFLGLVSLGVMTVFLLGGNVLYDLDLRPEDYAGILSHLAIVALITERFVEIFTSVIRKPGRTELEGDLREAKNKGETNQARERLDMYRAKTGIFAMGISFVTGLVIASVGVRILEPLFDTNELDATQILFFDGIDIVITAGVIAGGSKGINTLTSSIGAVFEALKFQSRATEARARGDSNA